ncbi:flavin-dependent oxidoreductase [Noviherbaspirillum suwonense]|uniref:2-polyprenyl-6-methoxyphenol hydroxylase n=1 Tax=Noviherbaspirillum suwonense TaxID=1224511 RepID=A0ABY1QKV9_9BURK|nr:flavin-dependent oxidoreductase [Noviherbaspirillum suwonense]SMP74341.1 2-polyprenyl-6-methoxyphenol hydroxylase [Noviherbaspirillum suwonense]
MKITIAGAGIGGLALALMLHKRGVEVELWEAVQDIKPLGVGINLLPHAVKELGELGLEDTLADIGIKTSQLAYYNRHGQQIWIEPRGRAAGYDWPQFSIHRGALQVALLRAAIERLGPQRVHAGHAFESFEQDADGVVARMRRRSDGALVETRGSMLVGADGIHSALRRLLHPVGDEPRFSGRMLWRAITESVPFMDGRSMFMAGYQDQKFVAYPISEPLRRQGRSLINWIAELRVPDGAPPATDWNKRVDRSVFAPAFDSWKWDWIDIPALIEGAATIYEFPLVDRDPLPRWTVGRVTLLGDAAHPMYPIGSNGSAQAILDARYLADCIADCAARGGDLLYALKEYEAERLPRTAGIVLRNRLNGPEQVMQIAEERAPNGFANIDDVIPFAERDEISQRYKRLAGFDRQSLADAARR